MSFLSSLNISGSGLSAQKLRMDILAQNIANAETTRTEDGGPYLKKSVVFSEQKSSFDEILKERQSGGVAITEIIENPDAVKRVYDPDHPDADADGYVQMPDISTTEQMVDLISASRSYEANITAFNAVKYMAAKALEIGK